MIPEFEKPSLLLPLRRNLHVATRRRTWSFKRNAHLEELLPPSFRPVRRRRSLWHNVVPVLLAVLMLRA